MILMYTDVVLEIYGPPILIALHRDDRVSLKCWVFIYDLSSVSTVPTCAGEVHFVTKGLCDFVVATVF